jgi:hypothetical protein
MATSFNLGLIQATESCRCLLLVFHLRELPEEIAVYKERKSKE